MAKLPAFLCALLPFAASIARAADPADRWLVAWYSFASGSGDVAKDATGKGNDARIHGARWVRGRWGAALAFDGKDDYVERKNASGLDVARVGTVELWLRAKAPQGGVLSRSTGPRPRGQRLALAFEAEGKNAGVLTWNLADGKASQRGAFGRIPVDTWTYVALTYDDVVVKAYRDGRMVATADQRVPVRYGSAPLLLGRRLGSGQAYFRGILSDVRIHNKSYREEYFARRFRQGAPGYGRNLTAPKAISLSKPQIFPDQDRLSAAVHWRDAGPLPAGAHFRLDVIPRRRPGKKRTFRVEPWEEPSREVVLHLTDFPPGKCDLRATLVAAGGKGLLKPVVQAFTWPRRKPGAAAPGRPVRMLNNFVSELLDVPSAKAGKLGQARFYRFRNPREGWVLVRSTATAGGDGEIRLALRIAGADKDVIVHRPGAPETIETMRYLPGGVRTLRVHRKGRATLQRLTVRSIAEIVYCAFRRDRRMDRRYPAGFGRYDWDFLRRHILPHVNVMVTWRKAMPEKPIVDEWRSRGGRWVDGRGMPWNAKTGDEAYAHWAQMPGFQRYDGLLIDEFSPKKDILPKFPVQLPPGLRMVSARETHVGGVLGQHEPTLLARQSPPMAKPAPRVGKHPHHGPGHLGLPGSHLRRLPQRRLQGLSGTTVPVPRHRPGVLRHPRGQQLAFLLRQ